MGREVHLGVQEGPGGLPGSLKGVGRPTHRSGRPTQRFGRSYVAHPKVWDWS